MNILMAASDNMYDGLELVIYSTMTHNRNVHWYIFSMDIGLMLEDGWHDFSRVSDDHMNKLRKIINYFDPNSSIELIITSECYSKNLEGNPNEKSLFTPFAALRLFADILLPKVHDCLYLDCDVSVQDNIEDAYKYYISKGVNYCAYSIPDACDWQGEMVSGVLFMNLDKIRETGFLKDARKNMWRNKYRYPDQMALRDSDTPYQISETYNYMFDLSKCNYTPAIIHYTNEISPKVYTVGNKVIFYRKFPFLQYVQDGIEMLENIELNY